MAFIAVLTFQSERAGYSQRLDGLVFGSRQSSAAAQLSVKQEQLFVVSKIVPQPRPSRLCQDRQIFGAPLALARIFAAPLILFSPILPTCGPFPLALVSK